MNDFLYFLIKASSIFIILYAIYKVCFSKMTFHTLNRVVMLAILPLSIMIPFINIEWFVNTPITNTNVSTLLNDFQPILNNIQEVGSSNNSFWNIYKVIQFLYGLGVVFGLIKLSFNILKLIHFKRNATIIKEGEFSIIYTDVKLIFSFFTWIFAPLDFPKNNHNSIIKHEKSHAKLWHTIDLIFTELFSIVFWFNPFVYFFRKDLKTIHEYQVDARLLQSGIKKSEYLQLMLNNIVAPYKFIGLYNYFNGLTIKKRVNMITKNKNSKWQLMRYLLIIPVIAMMTMSFTKSINNENDTPDIYPIKNGFKFEVSSHFGMRKHPKHKTEKLHTGIDLKAKTGTPIIATASGIITLVEFSKTGHGKRIIINHGSNYKTSYSHLDGFNVVQGEKVKKGEIIGYVGETGKASGPHLHYEVHQNGKSVNPINYF